MKYVFGPVPSRRLGRSLGIDPVPMKTCNWNCVYCQLGRSTPVVIKRRDYAPPEKIIEEVREALTRHGSGPGPEGIDWITFAGSGEPLLHSSIGFLIRRVKEMTNLPVALLTNGSLLCFEDIREEVLAVDAVIPTIDAGSADMFRRVNRPHPEISFDRYIEGLIAFREKYTGKFWPEVMLVKGLNDTEKALKDIANILVKMDPDLVHINVPVRPPAETWIEPPDDDGLMRALAILGDTARVVHPAHDDFDLRSYETVVDAIVAIVSRHPMREDEIRRALNRWPRADVDEAFADLEASGRVQIVERYGTRFWTSSSSRYPRV